MVFSEAEVGCKKHPNQPLQPGVCSSCLREKLSKLSFKTEILASALSPSSFSFSSLNYYSSASSSVASSPIHRIHRRNGSDLLCSMSLVMKGNSSGTGLKKSRSVASVARNGGNGKKKGGFWSKLLGSTTKRTKEVFMNSRTAKERLAC